MAGINFEVRTVPVSEDHPADTAPEDVPQFLACKKAKSMLSHVDDDTVVIGADTIVLLGQTIFEKPKNADDAKNMLRQLSGQTHRVITGVCLISATRKVAFSDVTDVTFHELTDREIDYYVSIFQPFDKAGSYACQEWIGAIGIARFEGDYFNVVGLPVSRVYRELQHFN